MADSSALAGQLGRASDVFGLADSLAREFHREMGSRSGLVIVEGSPLRRHREKIEEFWSTVLELRDLVQNPPEGFDDVAEQLLEAGKLAEQIRHLDGSDLLDFWPELSQVAHDGYEFTKAARKAARLDKSFSFLHVAPRPATVEPSNSTPTDSNAKPSTAPPKRKRSTERGEGRAKLIASLTNHHKYADGSCLNLEPIGNNELARLAKVRESTASAFFKQQFKGHGKYKVICADAAKLAAALKLLNGEFSPHHLYGAIPPDEGEREDEK